MRRDAAKTKSPAGTASQLALALLVAGCVFGADRPAWERMGSTPPARSAQSAPAKPPASPSQLGSRAQTVAIAGRERPPQPRPHLAPLQQRGR
ncbi:MAG: hypothetical protein U1E35_03405 [Rhodospirillales bacterium]